LLEKQGAFEVRGRPIPTPGTGDLLVKVPAVLLNPLEYKIRKYGLEGFFEGYPIILGSDAAGTVEKVGEGVEGFAVGDRVALQTPFKIDGAGFEQCALAQARFTAKIAPNVSLDEAATLPIAVSTVAIGLFGTVNYEGPGGAGMTAGRDKYAGKPILVFGDRPPLGKSVTVQVAKLSGFEPIIATASPHNESLVRSLGATHFVDRS
ncbi:GroES-like protein, partial [Gloeophyllum trabeum ATCC 11539]